MARIGGRVRKTIEIEVDEDFDLTVEYLSDEQLNECLKEARRRGLISAKEENSRELLDESYRSFMGRRPERGVESFEMAIFGDTHLLDCHRAIARRDWGAAVCALDKVLTPAPKGN